MSASLEAKRGGLPGLQIGRACAALSVTAFHLADRNDGTALFDNWLFFGRLGVDFFFVLSGFIIFYAHRGDIGRPGKLRDYLAKRITRIYPVYLLVLACVVALAFLTHAHARPPVPLQLLSEVTLFHLRPTPMIIGVEWTLFNEVAFYLFFVALILNKMSGLVIGAVWLAMIVAIHTYFPWGVWTEYRTLATCENLNFFFGILAALAYRRTPQRMASAGLAAAAAAVAAMILVEHHTGERMWMRLIYGLCFTLMVIYAAKIQLGRPGRAVSVLIALGDASYSLYLVHLPIESRLKLLFQKVHAPEALTFLPILVLTVGAAYAFHILVEKRVMSMLRPAGPSTPLTLTNWRDPARSAT